MPGILAWILGDLQDRAAAAHLWDVRVGAHWTFVGVELEGQRRGGLASTLSGGEHGGPPVRQAGRLLQAPVTELFKAFQSPTPER